MTHAPPDPIRDVETIHRSPARFTSARMENLEDVAFLSGMALAQLQEALGDGAVPQALLRERLALRAAEACMVFAGRPERAGELRDAVQFLRPGDLPGPAGETGLKWRRAVERPVSARALQRALDEGEATRIMGWLDVQSRVGGRDQMRAGGRDAVAKVEGQGAPIRRAAMVLETGLTEAPRTEAPALILADAALAQALGWDHLLPLLAAGLTRGDLRKRGDALRLACHRAVAASAAQARHLAEDLARRAARLDAVAPKLRAKGAGEAVAMLRTRDAVAPAALPLPDRAARRLCDRLVALGAVRELTGRDTFRLYGL